jgi:hypothetical protein
LDIIQPGIFYSFNQINADNKVRLKGNNINIGSIDTAMVLVPYTTQQWVPSKYDADGHYIKACHSKFPWVYVDNELCYYNKVL